MFHNFQFYDNELFAWVITFVAKLIQSWEPCLSTFIICPWLKKKMSSSQSLWWILDLEFFYKSFVRPHCPPRFIARDSTWHLHYLFISNLKIHHFSNAILLNRRENTSLKYAINSCRLQDSIKSKMKDFKPFFQVLSWNEISWWYIS